MTQPDSEPTDAQAGLTSAKAFRRLFPGVMVPMFLAVADQTILASALPTIASALGGLADLSWVMVGYLLAATIAAPLYGHLGDTFGKRKMLLGALAVFTLASLACALAPNLPLLIAARTVQGLGGGGLMTLAQAMIGENIAPRERGRFSGYFAVVFALAHTSGPVLGGYVTEQFGWRAVFAANIPLGMIAAFLALRIPADNVVRHVAFRLDLIGALLFCLSTFCFLFALSSAGHRFGWVSWELFALLAAAVIGFWLLLWWESRISDPVIPVRFLKVPAIARSDAAVACQSAALFCTVIYFPLYFQLGRGLGIGQSGLLLLPIVLSLTTSSALTGRQITKTGKVTLFPQIGFSVATLTFLGLAAALPYASTSVLIVGTALIGAGLGTVMPSTQVIVQTAAGRGALGSATGSMSLARALGGSIGLAIVGALLFAYIAKSDPLVATSLAEAMRGGPAYVMNMPGAERLALAARLDYCYRIIFVAIAIFTALGALVAATIPKPNW